MANAEPKPEPAIGAVQDASSEDADALEGRDGPRPCRKDGLPAASELHEKREYSNNEYDEQEAHSRLRIGKDGSCFMVCRERQTNRTASAVEISEQWNILKGAYKFEGGVARCSWDVHAERDLYELVTDKKDSGWVLMDRRASFKYLRIAIDDSAWQRLGVEEEVAVLTAGDVVASGSVLGLEVSGDLGPLMELLSQES